METEKMIYLVLEYASGGEIFGNYADYPIEKKTVLLFPASSVSLSYWI